VVLVTAFGKRSTKIKKQVLLEFLIGKDKFEGVFMVSPQLNNDAIIGCQLLKDYDITLHFGKKTISYIKEGLYRHISLEQDKGNKLVPNINQLELINMNITQDKLYETEKRLENIKGNKEETLDVTMNKVDLTVRHKDPDTSQPVKTSEEEINELTVSSVDETKYIVNEKDTKKVLLRTIKERCQNELNDVELDVENSGLLEDELPDMENWTYWKIRPPPKRKKRK
jgi:hypothetical protein